MFNERGHALLLVIFTVVFISVIGVSLITVTTNSNKTTVHERQSQSLYYIAESGINFSKSNIVQSINDIAESTSSYINNLPAKDRTQAQYLKKVKEQLRTMFCTSDIDLQCNKFIEVHNNFATQNGKHPSANVSSTFGCEDKEQTTICTINLLSKGFFTENLAQNRTLSQKIEIDLNRMMNVTTVSNNGGGTDQQDTDLTLLDMIRGFAVLTSETIKIDKKGKIEGNIGSLAGEDAITDNAEDKRTIVQNVSAFKGVDLNVLLPPFPTYPVNPVNYSSLNLTNSLAVTPMYNLNSLGNPSSASIDSKGGVDKYDLLDLSNKKYVFIDTLSTKNDLEIRTGNQDVYLVVNNLKVNNYDEIIINGTGKLTIIVKHEMLLKDKINETGNTSLLTLFYDSRKDLLIDDSSALIGGNFVIPDANVRIKSAKAIRGDINLLKGSISVESLVNLDGLFYVKNGVATFSYSSLTPIRFQKDIVIDQGTLNVLGYITVPNMYLNNVNVVFNNAPSPKVTQNFFLNKGNVDLQNDVDFLGDYIQHEGSLNLARQTNFEGNTYLGKINLSAANSVDFEGNVYLKEGDLNLGKSSDIFGDLYVLKGKINSTNIVDLHGNIYYADVHDVTLAKFVDVKKNQLIVAPNASFIIEKGSVDVKGTVVAKHVHVKDGYIKYERPTNIDDYYSNTPSPLDDDVIFTPLNDYMQESPLIEL